MIIPEAFRQFCRGLHQDVILDQLGAQDIVDQALLFVEPSGLPALRQFLDILLDGSRSSEEISALVKQSPASIHFDDANGAMELFRLTRRRLDTFPLPRA